MAVLGSLAQSNYSVTVFKTHGTCTLALYLLSPEGRFRCAGDDSVWARTPEVYHVSTRQCMHSSSVLVGLASHLILITVDVVDGR